jgi:hypothetical protein
MVDEEDDSVYRARLSSAFNTINVLGRSSRVTEELA